MQVTPAMAETVTFRIGNSFESASFPVSSGGLTNVPLDLVSSLIRDSVDWDDIAGDVGVDDGGGFGDLPEATNSAFPLCGVNLSASLCEDANGDLVFQQGELSLLPCGVDPDATWCRDALGNRTFEESPLRERTPIGSLEGDLISVDGLSGDDSNTVSRGNAAAEGADALRIAQAAGGLLPQPLQISQGVGPIDADPAGLQAFRVEATAFMPVPTRVNYADGVTTMFVDRFGDYALVAGPRRDIALPAGTSALGFHGAPGTPPDLLQGQLADPSALQVMFQFRDGVWLIFRPSGPSILNSLRSVEAHAPLFLSLSRATRWAGPVLYYGDRNVSIASGFTAVTYTGLNAITPETLMAQFSNASAVTALFAYDNTLTPEGGGYRIFRASGPSVLNDLAEINTFDVFFVLASQATSLSLSEFVLPE
ncbi:MAG: hypothetical protein DK306_001006 [Chloroflexi bacterium]|nr:MAG: hypothetical protein DK306_001006 [Chloroflexota bacterium]